MRHLMAPWIMLAAIAIARSVTAAGPCSLAVEMSEPLHRKAMVLAERNGAPTIVAESARAMYADDETLEARCAALPREERLKCLPCFVLEAVGAVRSGSVEALRDLYEPGFSQRKLESFLHHDSDGAVAPGYTEYRRLFPTGYALWDDIVVTGFGGERHDGRRFESVSWFFARRDSATDRWRGTREIQSLDYPLNLAHSDDVINEASADLRAIRLSLDRNSPPEKRTVRAEDVDRSDIEMDDIIVYLREERFPIEAPFLTLDPDTLDDAGRGVQEALATHLAWQVTEDIPDEEYLRLWAPTAQLNIKNYVRLRREHGVIKGFPGFRYSERDVPLMRMVSRVFTDHGVVWFGVTPPPPAPPAPVLMPGMPEIDASPAPVREPGFVVLYQVRLEDGSWMMLDSSWGALEVRLQLEDGSWVMYDPSSGTEQLRGVRGRKVLRSRDQSAMRLLGGGDLSGIAELLTREARRAMAGADNW